MNVSAYNATRSEAVLCFMEKMGQNYKSENNLNVQRVIRFDIADKVCLSCHTEVAERRTPDGSSQKSLGLAR